MKYTFFGHACFRLDTGKEKLLLIPSSREMEMPPYLPIG